MNGRVLTMVIVAFAATVMVSSCGSAQDEPAPISSTGAPQAGDSTTSGSGIAIDFRSDPDPLKSGDNSIEVTVRQPDGTPLTDATVTAVFSMPAMPSMNMPAMRSEAKLAHVENGIYRGMGQLSMGGTWNVVVTAMRDGEPVGRRSFSIVAK